MKPLVPTMGEFEFMRPYIARAFRAAGYGLCAILLLMANTYPLGGFWSIGLAIAVIGASTESARMGQLALAALLVMALIPYPMVLGLVQ